MAVQYIPSVVIYNLRHLQVPYYFMIYLIIYLHRKMRMNPSYGRVRLLQRRDLGVPAKQAMIYYFKQTNISLKKTFGRKFGTFININLELKFRHSRFNFYITT